MPKASSSVAESFARRLLAFDSTRVKIELLVACKEIAQIDADRMYEGLFLNIHTSFEQFLEDLFLGLLFSHNGLRSAQSGNMPRAKISTLKIAREIVFHGNAYINWMPYVNTIKLAEFYFRGGRPFNSLDSKSLDTLKKCHVIRNTIAHKSSSSYQAFNKHVLLNANLPQKEKTPAGFLRGNFRINPKQNRYEIFASELVNIARVLAK